MMRVLLLVLLTAPGCSLFTSPGEELDEARLRWERAGLAHYSFQYHMSCFCGAPAGLPLLVEVSNGTVVAAWNRNTWEPLDQAQRAQVPTIDDLFDLAAEVIRDADRYQISYHKELGYPARMEVDWIRNAIDDEVSHAVSCVHPIRDQPATSDPCDGPPEPPLSR